MRLAWLLFLPFLACGAPNSRTPVRGTDPPGLVRVATWNVHDLFDEVDRLDPPGELDDVPSPAEVALKLERVASVLDRLGADVVLLQEVENLALLRRLALRAGYPEARLVEGNDPRGIDVGLLSRWPVTAYLSHAGELGIDGHHLWPRDAVEAEVAAAGGALVIVGTHLSSHLSDPDGVRRTAQAARLRALADGAALRRPGALVLVGGDLNDPAEAPSLAPLLGDGRWRDGGAELAPALAWTWSGGAAREVLDHLALRAEDALLAVRVEGGADVAAASDHRPLVLELLLP
jgi:endonuclease/exonuclease/phosphatase family metal-dependent hydrolase